MKQIKDYQGIEVILHFEPEKEHDGLSMDDAIPFLYHILKID